MELTHYSIETTLVQLGNQSDPTTGAVNPPIYLSTAYKHNGIGESTGYDYSRTNSICMKNKIMFYPFFFQNHHYHEMIYYTNYIHNLKDISSRLYLHLYEFFL